MTDYFTQVTGMTAVASGLIAALISLGVVIMGWVLGRKWFASLADDAEFDKGYDYSSRDSDLQYEELKQRTDAELDAYYANEGHSEDVDG